MKKYIMAMVFFALIIAVCLGFIIFDYSAAFGFRGESYENITLCPDQQLYIQGASEVFLGARNRRNASSISYWVQNEDGTMQMYTGDTTVPLPKQSGIFRLAIVSRRTCLIAQTDRGVFDGYHHLTKSSLSLSNGLDYYYGGIPLWSLVLGCFGLLFTLMMFATRSKH